MWDEMGKRAGAGVSVGERMRAGAIWRASVSGRMRAGAVWRTRVSGVYASEGGAKA